MVGTTPCGINPSVVANRTVGCEESMRGVSMGRWRRRGWTSSGVVALVLVLSVGQAAGAQSIWRVVSTPNPGGEKVANIYFTGASSSSRTEAWGVGIDEIN